MTIEYRTLDYKDVAEVREYLRLLFAISAEGDEWHFEKSDEYIDRAVIKARREENASNTFAGLAREGRQIVFVDPATVDGLPLTKAAEVIVPSFLASDVYASMAP